jgi:hypothetical protein
MSANVTNLGFLSVPEELEVYLEHGSITDLATKKLLDLMKSKEPGKLIPFLTEILDRKPNSIVIIDPVEMLFKVDTIRKVPVLHMYGDLRNLLATYSSALFILTFNLRKRDRQAPRPDLLKDPRSWLEEVSDRSISKPI